MIDNCEKKKDMVMKNDDICAMEDENDGLRNQTTTQETLSNQRTINHDVTPYVTDEGSAFIGESTISTHDSSESNLKAVSTNSVSLIPSLSQKDGTSSADNKSLVSSGGQSSTDDVHTVELIGATQPLPPETCEHPPETCQICGQNSMGNSRAMVRFLPTANATTDISLHVFCGKIASILPQIAQPHLEILVTAGLKNKHGIGPYVNFALARTRSAVAQGGEAEKDPRRLDKEYYLVQEFEEHLKSIRGLQLNRKGLVTSLPNHLQLQSKPKVHKASRKSLKLDDSFANDRKEVQQPDQTGSFHPASLDRVKSCAPVLQNPTTLMQNSFPSHAASLDRRQEIASAHRPADTPSLRRMRCPCGGTYKGPARWKAHMKTPRHVRWETHATSESSSNIVDTAPKKVLLPESWPNNSLGLQQHIGKNQGNYPLAQAHAVVEGNHPFLQPHPGVDHINYSIPQPRTNEDLRNFISERQHEGSTARIEGGDIATRQETTSAEANPQSLSPSLLLLLLLLTPST